MPTLTNPQPSQPNQLAGLCVARARESLNESRARIPEIVLRLIQRQRDFNQGKTRIQSAIDRLAGWARQEELTDWQLARRAGLSWGTWRRLREGKVKHHDWLPVLEAAIARLIQS
jgi:hypothetical protein